MPWTQNRPHGGSWRTWATTSSSGWCRRSKAWLRIPGPPAEENCVVIKDIWRIRVGEYRIVYIIDDTQKLVGITRIAHRKDVYE